ncbi:IST1 homolog [Dioscorea cayenensis subsp. rotundata]|uniref:IST1 homolog n=1 Tax=Dioscorea cayennensis subsp. rotundata TaxID=55577 RepID=A0AB40AKI9_DIOCR|nr:IST1 homolog [Dioscorea cayenensis subsp. rotundata]
MATLSSLFNRSSFGVRCKTCLNLAISRIKLLRNKREAQLKHMHKEISQFLQTGQEAIARIRVEHVIREQNILAAYDILELFCEFILARIPILDTQRECPSELQEAVASIIFASPRCSDLPEFMQIRNLFTTKYGKEFVSSASELRPDSGVNRTLIEKLSVRVAPSDLRLKVLKDIAREHNVDWDSSSTEAEFRKKHEDLLEGLNSSNSPATAVDSLTNITTNTDRHLVSPSAQNQKIHQSEPQMFLTNTNSALKTANSSVQSIAKQQVNTQTEQECHGANPVVICSSDVLEQARAAIAAAERASAAARAAAELVNFKRVAQVSSDKHSK